MSIAVRPAQLDELIDLRHAVLRQGLPRSAAIFEGDTEPTTHHFAAIETNSIPNNVSRAADGAGPACPELVEGCRPGPNPATQAIIGCATILRRDWQSRPAWQLRGMAIHPTLQRQGIGRLLLKTIDDFIRADATTTQLWCNARVPAIPFYQNQGWQVVSEVFMIDAVIPHVKMTKQLT